MGTIDPELQRETFNSMDDYLDEEKSSKPLYEYVRTGIGMITLLSKEKYRILRRTVTLMAITLGLSLLSPNRYTATAILTPPDSEPMSGLDMLISSKTGMTQLASSSVGDMLGMRSPGQLYIQQMLSRPVQDRLIERFDLKSVYHTTAQEPTRKALTGVTNAQEDKKSGAITVSVTDKDPKRAANLANAYAEESGLLISRINADSARREREYFEKQLDEAKAELQKDTKELAAFGIQNGTIGAEAQGPALVAATATVEGQILATEAEIKGLLQIYSPQHERVLQMQAKDAALHQQLQQLKGKSQGDTGADTDSLKDMLKVSPEYSQLGEKVKIQASVVETLAQQFELSKLQETHKISNVQVFDPAIAPEEKSGPHRATLTVLVGLIFLFLQTGLIIARYQWNSLSSNDPWRQTLQPAVTSLSNAGIRVASIWAPGDRNFIARWRKKRAERHAELVAGR